MNSSPKKKVFLSYARADADRFAMALRERLQASQPHLEVWVDRADMVGGSNWWTQITDALDSSQSLVIVITAAAIVSPIVRTEWQYARQQGLPIIPVKGCPDEAIAWHKLPSWMLKAHFYDIDREWDGFINQIRSPRAVTRVPFMAPDLRDGFVQRLSESAQLMDCFLDSEKQNPTSAVVALHGGGGFGKSSIAAALCHNDDILSAFDDGVLWVTLGQKPKLEEAITKLYAALTGTRPGFVDAEDAAFHLAEKLNGKNCLIVLDDVWDSAHLRPLLRGGKTCAYLITTRVFDTTIGFKRIDIHEMQTSEAVEVLTNALDVRSKDLTHFQALAKRLGEWPIMLKLANGALRQRVARGQTIRGALDFLNQALDKKGVAVFDQAGTERDQAVAKTIEVSLDLLVSEERQRYIELSILPEGTDIPLTVIGTLWQMDDFDSQILVERLDNLSLLEFKLQTQIVSIHEVMRAYLFQLLRNAPDLHLRLARGWGNPFSLPSAYAWRWFTYHLAAADRKTELRQLLLDYEWLRSKLSATDMPALIADYEFLDDIPTRLIQAALRLSTHILATDKNQLSGQLLGRLGGLEIEDLETLLRQAKLWEESPWIRPLKATLVGPGGALLRTLVNEAGVTTAIAVTRSGRRAVAASSNESLKVWDLETGSEERNLQGHSERVSTVAITGDGRRAVSGSFDRTVRVWDLESMKEDWVLEGHNYGIVAVAVSDDGQVAISASLDETMKVWNLNTGRELRTLQIEGVGIAHIAMTPDGSRLLSALLDNTLRVWNLRDYGITATLSGHSAAITGIAMSADGRRGATSSLDGTVKVWDLDTGTETGTLKGHSSGVLAIAMIPDGRRAISGSLDETLRVWDLETGTEERILRGHHGAVLAVAATATGQRAISASLDGTVKVWQLDKDQYRVAIRGHSAAVTSVTSTQTQAISSSQDRTLRVWNLQSCEEVRTLLGHSSVVLGVTSTRDGRRAASASLDGTLRTWNLATGELETTIQCPGGALAVAIASDGGRLISANIDQSLSVWNLGDGTRQLLPSGHTEAVVALLFTNDGRKAVSASLDETVRIWDLENGTQDRVLVGHVGGALAIAVTPDGTQILAGTWTGMIKTWDLNTGQEEWTVTGHAAGIHGLSVTPDARYLISASEDHTVKIWDLRHKTVIATFTADGPLLASTLAPDGLTVIAGEQSGRLHFVHLEGLCSPKRVKSADQA